VLTGNIQLNFGVIWHFCYLVSYLVDNRKCGNLTVKLTPSSNISDYLLDKKEDNKNAR